MKNIFKKWYFWAIVVLVAVISYVLLYVWFDTDRKKAALLLAYLDLNKWGGTAAPKTEAGYNSLAKGYYDGTADAGYFGWKSWSGAGKGTKGASSSELNALIKANPDAWKAVKAMKPTF